MRHKPYQCELERYPLVIQADVRYGDCDVMGHVNNVAYARLFEEARIQFGMALHETKSLHHFGRRDRLMIVACHLFYLRELNYPARVTMGVGVTKVGNSSYTLSVGMFNADGDCVAANTSTLANGAEGKSAPISSELRERLEVYRMKLEGIDTP